MATTEEIRQGDCLPIMRAMLPNSIDAIVTDPPYFKVKDTAWDHQWDKPENFVAWIAELVEQWERILKPNGSLYVFASPKMSRAVESAIALRFDVLSQIVWLKHDGTGHGWHNKTRTEDLRSWFPQTERIIFAEHIGADNMAKGEEGYEAKRDNLRGFLFEPIRAYLAGEMERAGFDKAKVNGAWRKWKGGVGGMASHWFTSSQWTLPTEANYEWLRKIFNEGTKARTLGKTYDVLRKDYDILHVEYEKLAAEFEALRRPFSVTDDVQFNDVWNFATVPPAPGKHPSEKPLDLMQHIIQSSTKPGALVLDCFAGSGTTLEAAKLLGRGFIGIEKDPHWADVCRRAVAQPGTNAKGAKEIAVSRALQDYRRGLKTKGATCAKK